MLLALYKPANIKMSQVAQAEQEEILDEFHMLSFIKFSQKENQELKSISSEARWASKFKRTLEMKGIESWLQVNFTFLEKWSESQKNKALENKVALVETILETCPDHIKQWKIPLLAKGKVLDWFRELQEDFKFKLDCEAQETATKLIWLIKAVEANEDNNQLVIQIHKLAEKFKPKEDDPVYYIIKDILRKIIIRARVSPLHTEGALERKTYESLMEILVDIYRSLDIKERLRDVSEEVINVLTVKCSKCGLVDAHRLRCPDYLKGIQKYKYSKSKSKGALREARVKSNSSSDDESDSSSDDEPDSSSDEILFRKKRSKKDSEGKQG